MDPVKTGTTEAAPAEEILRQRKRHRRRVLAWTSGVLAVAVLIAATLSLGYRHLNHNVRSSNVSGMTGPRIADPAPGEQNILVVGSDSEAGNPHADTAAQSDTMMIVHLAANRKWAEVVSIPRDSWVNVPACNMGNGQTSSPEQFKIDEAFTLGSLYGDQATGAACAIRTLQQNTGVPIDHFVSINFNGFKDMVNALGGVPVCTSQAINDPQAHLYLPAGYRTLSGQQALGYVRARYTLGTGSDLERIGRQQAFMSSLANRAESELYNPVAIYRFLDAATRSVTVDSGLGGVRGLYALATEVRKLPANKLTFITMPTYPRSEIDPADTANVMWKQPQASEIFTSLREDVPLSTVEARQRSGHGSSAPATAAGLPGPAPSPAQGGAGPPGPAPSPAVSTRTANQNICT